MIVFGVVAQLITQLLVMLLYLIEQTSIARPVVDNHTICHVVWVWHWESGYFLLSFNFRQCKEEKPPYSNTKLLLTPSQTVQRESLRCYQLHNDVLSTMMVYWLTYVSISLNGCLLVWSSTTSKINSTMFQWYICGLSYFGVIHKS